MSGDQSAKAASNSQIVQSQRDTNIGFSADDMKGIIETLADQIPKFAAIASSIVEARLSTFEEKIMARFEDGSTSSTQAFADPDFQYLVSRAQYAYARSGDEVTADVLVDLIAQRSQQSERTRLSLSLNDAVERSAYLTINEFSELSLSYLLRHTVRNNLTNFSLLCEYLSQNAGPLVPYISKNESSYSYLASHSCGSIQITEVAFIEIMKGTYGGLICKGVDKGVFSSILGDDFEERFERLIIPSIHDSSRFQVNALNKDTLSQRLAEFGIPEKNDQLWGAHSNGFMTKDEFIQAAAVHYPAIEELITVWDDTPIKNLSLTSVGLAIGYANLKRVAAFQADLGIWIN